MKRVKALRRESEQSQQAGADLKSMIERHIDRLNANFTALFAAAKAFKRDGNEQMATRYKNMAAACASEVRV